MELVLLIMGIYLCMGLWLGLLAIRNKDEWFRKQIIIAIVCRFDEFVSKGELEKLEIEGKVFYRIKSGCRLSTMKKAFIANITLDFGTRYDIFMLGWNMLFWPSSLGSIVFHRLKKQ